MNALLLHNAGPALQVELMPATAKQGAQVVVTAMAGETVQAGERRAFAVAGLGLPLDVDIRSAGDLQAYAAYLAAPAGVQLTHGERVEAPGVFAAAALDGYVALSAEGSAPPAMTLPLQVRGLNPRWSAGCWQSRGYSPGYYGDGSNRWRAVAVDPD